MPLQTEFQRSKKTHHVITYTHSTQICGDSSQHPQEVMRRGLIEIQQWLPIVAASLN